MDSVLIIEDDEFVINMLKQTFERAGYEVGTASNGRAGLELYRSRPFDVVITDFDYAGYGGNRNHIHLTKRKPRGAGHRDLRRRA